MLNKRTLKLEESVHVVFDENPVSSTSDLSEDPFLEEPTVAQPLFERAHMPDPLNPSATPFSPSVHVTDDSHSDGEPATYHANPHHNTYTTIVPLSPQTIDYEEDSMPALSDDDIAGIFYPLLLDLTHLTDL